MPVGREAPKSPSRLRAGFVEGFVHTRVSWRSESARVRAAYARWLEAPPSDRAPAFAAYRAAVDREERAAAEHLAYVRDVQGTAA
jgi:hypothetical protein